MSKIILKVANSMLNVVVVFCLFIFGAYAVYALWDNQQVYAAAENVQDDMIKLKPVASEEEEGASFDELLAVNPDVVAWVTLDNTKIDYPVLQGENNLTYINTDVYGDFALAGSIYLDSRNDRNFKDTYSLLYGHHMENSGMFGDLDLYKDKKFFDENMTGELILPDRSYELEIFACLIVPASEDAIFEPDYRQHEIDSLLTYTEKNALYFRTEVMDKIRENKEEAQVLALSTCSTEFTDARTIVLAMMK